MSRLIYENDFQYIYNSFEILSTPDTILNKNLMLTVTRVGKRVLFSILVLILYAV